MGEREVGTDVVLTVRDTALRRLRRFGDEQVEAEAEDLANDVVAKFLVAVKLEEIRNPEAWANTAAAHAAIDLIRRRRVTEGLPRKLPDVVEGDQDPRRMRDQVVHNVSLDVWDEDTTDSVRRFIVQGIPNSRGGLLGQQAKLLEGLLSERELELVTLVADGVPHAEIAERMNYANANSVKATLTALRRKIESMAAAVGLDPDWEDHPRVY